MGGRNEVPHSKDMGGRNEVPHLKGGQNEVPHLKGGQNEVLQSKGGRDSYLRDCNIVKTFIQKDRRIRNEWLEAIFISKKHFLQVLKLRGLKRKKNQIKRIRYFH